MVLWRLLLVAGLALSLALSLAAHPGGAPRAPLSVAIPPPLNCKPSTTFLPTPAAPALRAAVEPNPGDADANLTFCSSVSGIVGSYSLNWTFGDGTYSTNPDPLHAYQAVANYTVTLTLNSTDFNTTQTLLVYVNPALAATATFTPSAPTTSTTVEFSAAVANGTPPYVTYWDFGTGANASGTEANHTFHSAGTYTVEVITNDSGAGSDVQYLQVKVTSPPLFLGGSTGILIGTSVAAVAVAVAGFGYFQWEKRRRPRRPTPPPDPPPGS